MERFQPKKRAKSEPFLDPGSRVPGPRRDPWNISRNFGEVNYRIESDVEGGYQRNTPQQK